MKTIRIRRVRLTTSLAVSMAVYQHSTTFAYACLRFNAWKGSDIGSLDPQTRELVSLFNPRYHVWSDHFVFRGAVIEPLTAEGNATARLLKLNLDKRIAERQLLAASGRYPR
jgi:hypothetical protein